MSYLALCTTILLGLWSDVRGPDVVVTAAPPVNAERLADTLRTYLSGSGVRVDSANAPASGSPDSGENAGRSGDLREQLAGARRTGEDLHAVIVVRADPAAAGRIEITLVDLATDKALVSSIARPRRDEDLYRTLALKIQALVHATLSEAPQQLAPGSPEARLAASASASAEADANRESERRIGLAVESGFMMLALATRVSTQGLSVTAAVRLLPGFDVTLGIADLGAIRAQSMDVVAVASLVPLTLAVRARLGGPRFELLAGPTVEVAIANVSTTATTTMVRSSRDLMVAAGGEVEGRGRFSSRAWAYARLAGLGVVSGLSYLVAGQTVLEVTGPQVAVGVGLGVDLR